MIISNLFYKLYNICCILNYLNFLINKTFLVNYVIENNLLFLKDRK